MFDKDRFIADCQAAVATGAGHVAVADVVAGAVADPAQVIAALGEPARGELQVLHRSDDLAIINVLWAPRMTVPPHDHQTWAVIGVYAGREDNIYWRRVKDDAQGRIEAAGARSLGPCECLPMGRDIVHSVTNPTSRVTAAIHVYGGEFFTAERHEWEPEGLTEQAYDVERTMRLFEAANR